MMEKSADKSQKRYKLLTLFNKEYGGKQMKATRTKSESLILYTISYNTIRFKRSKGQKVKGQSVL
jgi:hypothetical protein